MNPGSGRSPSSYILSAISVLRIGVDVCSSTISIPLLGENRIPRTNVMGAESCWSLLLSRFENLEVKGEAFEFEISHTLINNGLFPMLFERDLATE